MTHSNKRTSPHDEVSSRSVRTDCQPAASPGTTIPKAILAAAAATAVAGYLLGTESGRNMQRRIGGTLKHFFRRLQNGSLTGLGILRRTAGSAAEEDEEEPESEVVRLDKLRRVP